MPPWARFALPLLLVGPMLGIAGAAGVDEVIFPEGAALVMGIWGLGLPGWTASRWRIVVLPPACAVAGILIVRADIPLEVAEIVGVSFGLLALAALDSRLAPSLSATALPIVFDVSEWAYPIAVLVICVVIVVGLRWPAALPAPSARPGRYPWRVAAAAWVAIAAWILLGGGLLSLTPVALAPPLFVSALDWLGQGGAGADLVQRWALMVGAGLVGASALAVIPVAWVAGLLAAAATLVLMRVLATPHPPALAVALIPQIVDTLEPWEFAVAIGAGAGALYMGVLLLSRVPAYARRVPA